MPLLKKQKIFVDALPLCQPRMSGIGHLVLELVRALAARNNLEIILVVPLGKRDAVLRHGIDNVSVKTIPVPARVISLLMSLRIMPPVDIILGRGTYLFPNYRNWPLVFSKSLTYFHDATFMLYPETVAPKNLKYLIHNSHLWLKRTDVVITLSNASKREITQTLGVVSDKIYVIPCGVDKSTYYPRTLQEIDAAKQKYNIMFEKYLLSVGNLEPRKNIDRLLIAYSKLPAAVRDEHGLLLIGGDGWLNESTTQIIGELQEDGLRICRPSKYVEDEDMPALYSGSSLLVHPAIYEGFGIPPLEAMACGVPVAASNIPSISEVAEKNALYFDPNSVDNISSVLEKGLTDGKIRSELIGSGKKRADNFSWEGAAVSLEKLIEDINK